MEQYDVLGQGLYGVVVQDGLNGVKKFYRGQEGWEKETTALRFMNDLQAQGLEIGCRIPQLLETADGGSWQIRDTTYNYCNKMEFIPGLQAAQDFPTKNFATLGTNIGTVLFHLHHYSKPYRTLWTSEFGDGDNLFKHIVTEKAGFVMEEEEDPEVRERTYNAVHYLNSKKELLEADRTLSHTDLNLKNILVSTDNTVEGLVDWGDLGLTNPSLTLYQLATSPYLYEHVRKQYSKLGSTILDDVVYAAATIHGAWAPLRLKQLGLPVEEDDSRERFEEIYASFMATANT
jgi:Ser/Thr protein kinase RdoA (MazF antagonist)